MDKKLSVAFLWHMHQPLYKDLVTGKYILPWVRLHSTYSYLDMISVLKDFPNIKVTFNITPSLLWQLVDISENGCENEEYYRLTLKNAKDLTSSEKVFILKNFFSCDLNSAIIPVKRYKELYDKRGDSLEEELLAIRAKEFSEQDFRDLQLLFNLAWCGYTLKEKDKLVHSLVFKAKHFSEEDKSLLLKKQLEIVKKIIPEYKKLQDSGQIEISTTPFYHPILPILCGDNPGKKFDFKKDAKIQIDRAVAYYEELFGKKPVGMWPSEGSVSQSIIPMLAEAGIKWIATDEGILVESFRGEDISRGKLIYNVYTASEGDSKVDMVFRDINLSNAISFRYANMPHKKAAETFIEDVEGIKRAMDNNNEEYLVSVILDGENPWPYYSDGGKKFLTEVYKKLSKKEEVETVTIGEYLDKNIAKKQIKKLYSGSWIDRNFNKWIGSPQKNKAWEYLNQVKDDVVSTKNVSKEALEELYIAEGSDWFWWHDDFGTELNLIFDKLFRLHLKNVYSLMGKEIPDFLNKPIPASSSIKKISISDAPSEMASTQKIVFVSSEVFPFSKTGGLADVAGSLPKTLVSLGDDVRVFTPCYGAIKTKGYSLKEEKMGVSCVLGGETYTFNLLSIRENGVTTYFIDNDKFFNRSGFYGNNYGDYRDNALRFAFFSRAVLEAIKILDFKPDVIHCNDWQSALIPLYIKFIYAKEDGFYQGIRTLYTIHNIAYQGLFDKKWMARLDIPKNLFNFNDIEFYGKINFMKAGILYSDVINTVSNRYAEEIMTKEYGVGLEGLIKSKKDFLYGIPNGADYSVWSPKTDEYIKENYDMNSLEKKKECKKDLIKETGLTIEENQPLLGFVGRLVEQKGMDLLTSIMGKLVENGVGFVILGSGDLYYQELFMVLAKTYPGKIYVCNDFNDKLAHKIEAGADIFLMPSKYEPCGLNQMYSIKYGTVPIVRATGGLDDVIVDYDTDMEKSNGFKFKVPYPECLYEKIGRALEIFQKKKEWDELMKRGMSYDFSWEISAKKYRELYRQIMV